MIAVSACLLGETCRYDGKRVEKLAMDPHTDYIGVCPELFSGFTVPRKPCEILGGDGSDVFDGKGKIVDIDGSDITEAMLAGAKLAVAICVNAGVSCVYLHANSPSCGCGRIYDGSFSGKMKDGDGIFTALLKRNSIDVISVEREG